jgi:osmotically inducible protein OsmC
MIRAANAEWDGRLKDGQGLLSTESGILHSAPYSFATRFGNIPGTNPEELIAAAHAGCFSMSLANELEIAQLAASRIETKASVKIDMIDGNWTIREVDLHLKTSLWGAPSIPFLVAASRAKANCPVSRLLSARVNLLTEIQDLHLSPDDGSEITVYTSSFSHFCEKAKELLDSQGIKYREIDLDREPPEVAEAIHRKTGLTSVPQIFAGPHFIGSYKDLIRLDADHGLQQLLKPRGKTDAASKAG